MAVQEEVWRSGEALEPASEVEITAIVGNGRILAGFDRTGALKAFTAPHVDDPQHIRSSRIAVRSGATGDDMWLDGPAWTHSQQYLDGTDILVTRSMRSDGRIVLEQRATSVVDAVLIGITASRVDLPNQSLVSFDFAFQLGGQPLANALIYSPADGSVLAYHREHALAIRMLPSMSEVGVRSLGSVEGGVTVGSEPLMTAGEVSATITGQLPARGCLFLVVAWGTPDDAASKVSELRSQIVAANSWPMELTGDSPVQRVPPMDPSFTESLSQIDASAPDCYRRSLTVIQQLADRSGAFIAGPPIDAAFRASGGYAFCWPRDGGFIAHALGIAGQREAARAFFDWALDVQPSDGIWKQRYYADGTVGPCWTDHQLDGVGTVLWALDRYLMVWEDADLAARGLDAAVRSFEEIARFADVDGWPPVTQNLWEDQRGAHLYTAASLLAAARAWRVRANDPSSAKNARLLHWIESQLDRTLREWPVDSKTGALARTLTRESSSGKTIPDFTADASLLGLSVPFGCLEANDPRLRATVDVIQNELSSGLRVRRYAGDRYRGGNAWPLNGLWLAWHHARTGDRNQALRLYHRVLNDRPPSGLLAEQVDVETGRAKWVVPLSWAHAWFLLASHALVSGDTA